jgi:hypothetical protein
MHRRRFTEFSATLAGLIIVTLGLTYGKSCQADVYFTLSGNTQNSNLIFQSVRSRIISGTAALDIGSFMRLGVTHRQKFEDNQEYVLISDADPNNIIVENTKSSIHQTSNSLDLTLVLYEGALITPYINGGVVFKNYRITSSDADNKSVVLPPQPSGGFGLGIMLSREFSLKISYTISPGMRWNPDRSRADRVLDNYTELGITYKI